MALRAYAPIREVVRTPGNVAIATVSGLYRSTSSLATQAETGTTIRDQMATVPDSEVRRRTSTAIDVAAVESDGMRRQPEHPEIEKVARLQCSVVGMPSALRA